MTIPREERKNAIGIAMSGGGLQGIAHVGALRALYELGIRPQFISGTSSGSAIAAVAAMGFEPDEMEEFAKKNWKTLANFDKGPVFKSIARFMLQKKKSKSDGLRPGEMISDLIGEAMSEKGINGFSDLPINLSVCTVDSLTTDEVIFTTEDEGLERPHIHYESGAPLAMAVRASMSFPAVFTTCNYKQYNCFDGGSKDNLPVQILRDMGVGKVLAVGFDIMGYTPAEGFDGMMGVLLRALDVYSIDRTRESMEMADLAVLIKNEDTALFEMGDIDVTIREGYECVMKQKDKILEIFG